jgi:hypothetical protein
MSGVLRTGAFTAAGWISAMGSGALPASSISTRNMFAADMNLNGDVLW